MFKNKLDAALYYAKKGYSVFLLWYMSNGKCACRSQKNCKPAKHPIADNGLYSGTTNRKVIKRRWTAYPDANIGLRTGKNYRIVVVDVDGKKGKKSLKKLEKKYGKLLPTVTVITGNGFHLYFKAPVQEIKSSNGEIAEGIDIKAEGAYIIAAQSVHESEFVYKFREGHSFDDIKLAEMSDWLIKLTERPRNPAKKTNSIRSASTIDGGSITDGRRNGDLTSIAGYHRYKGCEYPELINILKAINNKRCRPPLPDKEVEGIAKSIAKYPPGTRQDDTSDIRQKIPKVLDNLPGDRVEALTALLEDKAIIEDLANLSNNDPKNFEIFLSKLSKRGFSTRNIDSLKKSIKHAAKVVISIAPSIGVRVFENIPNAPVTEEYMVPDGFRMQISGIFKSIITNKQEIEKQIATAPVLITIRFKSLDGNEHLTLVWYRDGKCLTTVVERSVVADRNKIIGLSDKGFPVTSSTGKDLVEFLCLLENLNINILPVSRLSKQLGWQGKNGSLGYILHRFIPMDGSKSLSCKPTCNDMNTICFTSDGAGEEQIFNGLGTNKSMVPWLKAANMVKDYPVMCFMVYASLGAPLLEILNLPTFIVDLSSATSTGKTTALRFAASCYGNPNSPGMVRSWNMTNVFAERSLAVSNGIPVLLDDTKLIRNPDFISKVIYEASLGQGRGRGSIKGTASTSTWKTIILSTGESKITDVGNKGDGGLHARVIPVTLMPFGKKSKKINNIITELNNIIRSSYGMPAWLFVRYIIKNKDSWAAWREKYSSIREKYQKSANDSGIGYRICESFAVIELAAVLAKDALNLDWNYDEHLEFVFDHMIAEVKKSSNLPLESLKHVLGVAVSRKDHFWPSPNLNQLQPHQGWLGTWQKNGNLAFITSNLRELLDKQGYEPNAMLKQWKNLKWLNTADEAKGLTKKVVIDGKRVRCYVIKAKIVRRFM